MSKDEAERATLRKDFLNILQTFEGQSNATVTLCTQSVSTQTKVTGFDREILHMVVDNFTSPANEKYESAILRLTDVDSVAFKIEK